MYPKASTDVKAKLFLWNRGGWGCGSQNGSLNPCFLTHSLLWAIMVVKVLKPDNPKQSYAHLTFGVLKSMELEKLASKVWGLSLGQLPTGTPK